MPLHPQIAAALQASAHLRWSPELPLEQARQQFRQRTALAPPPSEPLAAVQDLALAEHGQRLAARLYRPQGTGMFPLLVFFHGGGFVLGDLDTHDGLCRRLCARTPALVLAVDYRRAPEHPFPAAVEDAWRAVRWAHREAERLGADPARLAVVGDSSGGTLAAATALRCRDQNGPSLAAQALFYPALDHYTASTPSQLEMAEGYGLSLASLRWYWDQYLPEPRARLDPYAVPARAASLARLPPTLIVTAEYDVLRDEAERYAARAAAAGVAVAARRYADMNHGFLGLAGWLAEADRAIDESCAWLARRRS